MTNFGETVQQARTGAFLFIEQLVSFDAIFSFHGNQSMIMMGRVAAASCFAHANLNSDQERRHQTKHRHYGWLMEHWIKSKLEGHTISTKTHAFCVVLLRQKEKKSCSKQKLQNRSGVKICLLILSKILSLPNQCDCGENIRSLVGEVRCLEEARRRRLQLSGLGTPLRCFCGNVRGRLFGRLSTRIHTQQRRLRRVRLLCRLLCLQQINHSDE